MILYTYHISLGYRAHAANIQVYVHKRRRTYKKSRMIHLYIIITGVIKIRSSGTVLFLSIFFLVYVIKGEILS